VAKNFAEIVAHHDEFCYIVWKYKVRSRGRVRIRVTIKVRIRLHVGDGCNIQNKTWCRVQCMYYMHNTVYIISAKKYT